MTRHPVCAHGSSPGGSSLPTVVLNVLGLGLLVVGWVAVSGKASLSDQGPLLNLSLAGMLLAGIGNAFWITGRRRRLDARLAHLRQRYETEAF